VHLGAGTWSSCGITTDLASVHCWGDWGASFTGPGAVVSGTQAPVFEVRTGEQFGCVSSGDAGVYCMGVGDPFLGGDGTIQARLVAGTSGAAHLTVGARFACIVDVDGDVLCWGFNDNGVLGFAPDGGTAAFPPARIALSEKAVEIGGGYVHACARLASGKVACWGWNATAQCGGNAVGGDIATPVEVPGITTAVSLSVGSNHTCVVLADQSVRCWGSNSNGQLGSTGGTTGFPVKVPL
jgi:hypothetical protein